ncbi:hypothetical protein OIU78_022502 [Salix suchowensis]|nr:hypothetical protein OIU78_022502 [Salix suchowensis]
MQFSIHKPEPEQPILVTTTKARINPSKLPLRNHSSPPITRKPAFKAYHFKMGEGACSDFFMPNNNCSNLINGRTGLQVTARTAGAAKTIEVEVDKPLGLTLGQKSGGGVVITGVEGGGNAAKAGLKSGDQVLYTSSFFGDELWPADKLGFTKTAIQAKPDSIYFVVSRGAEVDVKRLPKRPAPPRFGRKLTETQKARATHICIDCGFIYTLQKPFDDQAPGCIRLPTM